MRRLLFVAPILACVTLAGRTGGRRGRGSPCRADHRAGYEGGHGADRQPGNPQVLSYAEESFWGDSVPNMPEPGDLVIGPLVIISGKMVANANPAGFGEHGSYKIPFFVPRGTR